MNGSMIVHLCSIVSLSIVIYLFGTACLARIPKLKKMNVYFRIALLGLLSLPLIEACRFWLSGGVANYILFDSISHLSLGILFAHLICLPDRALTLRILAELYEARVLSLEELDLRFSLSEMMNSRLVQMRKGGLLEVAPDGKITLRSKGVLIGQFVLKGRRFFDIKSAN